MKLAQLQLILFTTSLVTSIKVFSFNSTGDKDPPSSALLVQSPEQDLPDRFTICFAMRQDKIDRQSPLIIRGKNREPWIAFSIWDQGRITLWAEVGKKTWKKFQVLPGPWKFWSHICGDIDTVSGNITLSIDGLTPVTNNFDKLEEEKPNNLDQRLEIGISETIDGYGGKQAFRGEVSNVHFYIADGSTSVKTLSENPCETKGSYLAWSDLRFNINGDNAFVVEKGEDEVCRVQQKFHNLVLPGKMTWYEANHMCKVIGQGVMTDIVNNNDLKTFALDMNIFKKSCPVFWLPISDVKKEGVWKNTNTNSEPALLKWAEGQPNGLQDQNHAALFLETLSFGDVSAEEKYCTSCTSRTHASLTLRGTCKSSFLGKGIHPEKHRKNCECCPGHYLIVNQYSSMS